MPNNKDVGSFVPNLKFPFVFHTPTLHKLHTHSKSISLVKREGSYLEEEEDVQTMRFFSFCHKLYGAQVQMLTL